MEISVENQVVQIIVPQQLKSHNQSMMENHLTVLNRTDISPMPNSATSTTHASEFCCNILNELCELYKNVKKNIFVRNWFLFTYINCMRLCVFHENNKFKTLIVCSDGVITEKLCPDGMVFNDYSIDQEKCDLPFNIDCTKRSKLREYFAYSYIHCRYIVRCIKGMFNHI